MCAACTCGKPRPRNPSSTRPAGSCRTRVPERRVDVRLAVPLVRHRRGLVVRHRHVALRRRPSHQRLPPPRTGSTTRGRRRGDVRRAGPLGPRDDADPSDDPRGIQPRVVAPDLSEHGPRPVPRRGHWPLVPDEGARPSIPRRELGAPRGRMDFETWQPFYEQILNDFGFSREKDEAVAAELDKLLGGNRVPDSILRKIIRGKEVTVAGKGPNLEDENRGAPGGLLTPGEGVSVAPRPGLLPAILG